MRVVGHHRRIAWLLVLAGIWACSSGPSRRSSGAGQERLVTVERLPERERELLAAYGRGGSAWEARRSQLASEPELARFLVDNLVLELLRSYRRLGSGDEAAAAAFDRARWELVALGESSVPVLLELMALEDGTAASLAMELLARIGAPAARGLAASPRSPRAEPRRRFAELAGKLGDVGPVGRSLAEALQDMALSDPDWTVRAESAAALGTRGLCELGREGQQGLASDAGPWRKTLERCLADADPAVVEQAAGALVLLGDARAVPSLIASLSRGERQGNLREVRAAQGALVGLTGARGPDCADEWEQWWSKERASNRSLP
jgi:hypothetical protein